MVAACVVPNTQRDASRGTSRPPTAAAELDLGRVRAAAIAVGTVRYFYPGDDTTLVDWQAFLPWYFDQVVGGRELTSVLSASFREIAPEVSIRETGAPEPSTGAAAQATTGEFLTRWVHYGLGADEEAVYRGFRDGLENGTTAAAAFHVPVAAEAIDGCVRLTLQASVRSIDARAVVAIAIWIDGPGTSWRWQPKKVVATGTVSAEIDLSKGDLVRVGVAFRRGVGGIAIDTLTTACDGKAPRPVVTRGMVSQNLVADLYELRVDDRCAGQGCFFVGRKLTTAFDASRDVLIQDLGKGVTMRMPLARWASRTDQATSVTSGLPRRASALGVARGRRDHVRHLASLLPL